MFTIFPPNRTSWISKVFSIVLHCVTLPFAALHVPFCLRFCWCCLRSCTCWWSCLLLQLLTLLSCLLGHGSLRLLTMLRYHADMSSSDCLQALDLVLPRPNTFWTRQQQGYLMPNRDRGHIAEFTAEQITLSCAEMWVLIVWPVIVLPSGMELRAD